MGVAGKNKKIKENQMLGNLIKERLIINMQCSLCILKVGAFYVSFFMTFYLNFLLSRVKRHMFLLAYSNEEPTK